MRWVAFFFLLLTSCAYSPHSSAYREFYRHLDSDTKDDAVSMKESSYFLVILVEARHLDYSSPHSFFKTLAKHPSDGSKNGDVGHAWIYLQGIQEGQIVCLEGGHSGELGNLQPRYMEGVFLHYECGHENPIAYLWECQRDGFFQYGSGRHEPTFAAKVDLSAEQFTRILRFIEGYDFSEYSITGNQCSSFATQIAAFAGLNLDCEISVNVEQQVRIGGHQVCLWKDPVYAEITFSSPDILERSLMRAVEGGRAQNAMNWYRRTHSTQKRNWQDLLLFPGRYMRFKTL